MSDVNHIIECGNCGKEIYYGNSFDSLFLTDVVSDEDGWLKSVAKRVCYDCHEKEEQQMAEIESRKKADEERKLLVCCDNCRFRDDDADKEPCCYCKENKSSLFRQRSRYDEARDLIDEMRKMLKNLEHFIGEIEEDGQTVRTDNPDSGSDDRDND